MNKKADRFRATVRIILSLAAVILMLSGCVSGGDERNPFGVGEDSDDDDNDDNDNNNDDNDDNNNDNDDNDTGGDSDSDSDTSVDDCDAIMDPDLTEIGVGYAQVQGSDYTHYWTQDFATPW
jgi:hypothetical protein